MRTDGPGEGDGGVASPTLKEVLFVDDEVDVLDGLRDALRGHRRVWRMRFAIGSVAALAELEREPVDVIVSDIQMPGMDGADLLAAVQERYPGTIRIVLSGYARTAAVTRASTVAHRILGKPCNADELALVIERSCALHELTGSAEQFRMAAGATTLPSRPSVYAEVSRLLADPAAGPDDIASVIERDTAMTAKLLQLANSAFFGVGRSVSRVRDAVVFLGSDTIKSLTLSVEAFSRLAPDGLRGFSIEEFQHHATLAARISAGLLAPGFVQQDAITAALLHDIGQLVSIADDRQRWQEIVAEAHRRRLPVYLIEQERQGITHAQTGAYLLSLWGLPDGVVEAVAHHHDPGAVPGTTLDAVSAVHIADALAHEVRSEAGAETPGALLDAELLERIGVSARLDEWRDLAASVERALASGAPRSRVG